MDETLAAVKVIFQDPFWLLLFERTSEGRLSVCKVTFGAEPKDYEVKEFLLKNYWRLRFSPAVETTVKVMHTNPKRAQREAHKLVRERGIGTKSQQALNLQREAMKMERKAYGREQREADQFRKFELKQQKKREKHRGR